MEIGEEIIGVGGKYVRNGELGDINVPGTDSMDDLFKEHDINSVGGHCKFADKQLFIGLRNLPWNPYKWKRKPKDILKAIIYRILATDYFFYFGK